MSSKGSFLRWQDGLFVGLTAVFVGYFGVWLPGPVTGLQFIGLEMGEWTKFLGVDATRNLFYLPPLTLGLMLALLSGRLPNGRWQTWLLRGVALLVSLLAFPALEDLTGPSQGEYVPRLWFIGAVGVGVAIAILLSARRQRPLPSTLPWLLMALLGVLGALLPLWLTMAVRPLVAQISGTAVGVGWGVWLNSGGHLLVTAVCLWRLAQRSPAIV